MKRFLLLCLVAVSCGESKPPHLPNQRIWFTYPAQYWNSQALHLGNGYFGASFFGGIEQETFALSEASMWTGEPANGDWEAAGVNPRAIEFIPRIREAVLEGRSKDADSLVADNVFGSMELYGNFTSIGDLKIKFLNHGPTPAKYHRELDLGNSLGLIKYELSGTTFSREYFCSYPDRVLAMKFDASTPGSISFNLSTSIIQDSSVVSISGKTYSLRGFINGNQRPFQVLIQVTNDGGSVGQEGEALTVRAANSVVLYLTMATNYEMSYPDYTGKDPEITTRAVMEKVRGLSFDKLKDRHISDYRSLYDRVTLELEGNPEKEVLPTNERFESLKSGGLDPGYKVLAYNLGKYMIISSSRPNTLPANLQGVWNAFRVAPWSGNYQSNINLQEIYWSCGPMDLLECQQAYIDWIDNLAISGREIARRVYGTGGWVSHTIGNIWGHCAPAGGHPWAMYPMGAAWHCQHVWDQYAFSQDRKYLEKQAYPLLRDASIFWLENLIPFEGYLITSPTVSAEHGALFTEDGLNPAFHDFKSENYVYSLPGVYQDMQMIWDLFTNTSKAAQIVGDTEFADTLFETRDKLLPLKIGKYGQLQEWYQDIDYPDGHHRHIAHLYAVQPGSQIHPTSTPELAQAAKKSLDMRGDGRFMEQELAAGGNWARAHRMWCWARLMDGNWANKILTEMLTEQGFENVLTFQHASYGWEREDFFMEGDLYLHFQLDGSASVPGLMAAMLVQSHLDEIHLLPALPDEFKTGKITGLKARGGYTIDMEWQNGALISGLIKTPEGKTPSVRLKNDIISLDDLDNIKLVNY